MNIAEIFDLSKIFMVAVAEKAVWDDVSDLLSMLMASSMIHQNHHWNSAGENFYSDHLLFERIYNETQEDIDSLAEKIVGGPSSKIDLLKTSELMNDLIQAQQEDNHVTSSLKIEEIILDHISKIINLLESQNELSHGMSNLLEGIHDKHESFVYLLKQRLS
jgi:starvation-inducible DNA-binding protein